MTTFLISKTKTKKDKPKSPYWNNPRVRPVNPTSPKPSKAKAKVKANSTTSKE